ncbi:MAG: NADPH-dependent FMN reductase [Micromonosporaceae bacterium]
MSTILAISGSPSGTSRTAKVLNLVTRRLAADGHRAHLLSVRDLPPQALLGADPDHPAIAAVARCLAAADGVVIATPVYKAAYSGALKALLDLLPQHALAGKVVLPLATGGTLAHVLAIDYALRPVLTAMGADHVVNGYFLHDRLLTDTGDGGVRIDESVRVAFDQAVDGFRRALRHRARSVRPERLPAPANGAVQRAAVGGVVEA